jgi:hypothetical protein
MLKPSARAEVLLPALDRLIDLTCASSRTRTRRCRCSRARTASRRRPRRSARKSRTSSRASSASAARSPRRDARQDQRRGRQLQRARRGLSRRRLAGERARFVESLGLAWNPYTTQIEPHDCIAEYCDALARIDTILIDLRRDVWGYISLGYFKQRTGPAKSARRRCRTRSTRSTSRTPKATSASRTRCAHFAEKLPISRWQRDLTDSTVLRNRSASRLGHALIGLDARRCACADLASSSSTIRTRLAADLDANWEVLAEPIQTVMRRYGLPPSPTSS